LWFTHRDGYRAARRALVGATLVALTCYLLVPTAPPRLVGGYHDLLAATADIGWWSTSASAPRGLGGLTNQLAAMPSMHAGWAVWSALALHAYARSRSVRTLGWLHAVATAVVVVGTGNHWSLDVVAGAALVALFWALVHSTETRPTRRPDPTSKRRAGLLKVAR
jgi:membrane-associated phospholipid phosphatase